MLNLAHSTRSALERAQVLEFHEPSSVLYISPRSAARPRTEASGAELSQRGLGGSAARWRGWRLSGASQPVCGLRRTGRHLRRGRRGQIRGKPSRPRSQWRVFDGASETVVAANHPFNVSKNRTGSPVEGATISPCHITRRPRTKVPTGQPVTRTPS